MKKTVNVREDAVIVGTEQDGWKFTADDIFVLRDGKEIPIIEEMEEINKNTVVVVRCKDCKHRTNMGNCGHPRQHGILPTAYPYDFCSYGERR